jgi:hypothetical protein
MAAKPLAIETASQTILNNFETMTGYDSEAYSEADMLALALCEAN